MSHFYLCNVFSTKKSMAPQLRRLGVGAKTSCLSKFLHPSEQIRNKYPNPVAGHRLEGCVVVRQEIKSVSRKDQLCVVVRHDDFKAGEDHIELHAVKRYFRVTMEGDPDLFFDVGPTTDNGKLMKLRLPSQQLWMKQSMGALK